MASFEFGVSSRHCPTKSSGRAAAGPQKLLAFISVYQRSKQRFRFVQFISHRIGEIRSHRTCSLVHYLCFISGMALASREAQGSSGKLEHNCPRSELLHAGEPGRTIAAIVCCLSKQFPGPSRSIPDHQPDRIARQADRLQRSHNNPY